MCLAIPMQIVKIISDDKVIASLGDVEREINTGLIDKTRIGDYVMVHAGFAIQVVDKKDAEETLNILKEIS